MLKEPKTSSTIADEVNWYIEQNLVHSIHTSSRLSYRGCRRRWDWSSRQMYYPLVTPRPLEFGSAFHKAMEKYYDPLTWHDKEIAAALSLSAFVEECKAQYSKYLKLNKGNIDPDMKAEYDDRIKMGLGMLRYYTKWVSPLYDVNFKPVKVEVEFEVPIKSPEGAYMWCKCEQCQRRWKHHDAGSNDHDDWQERTRATLLREGKTDEEAVAYCVDEVNYWTQWVGLPVTYGGRIDMLAQDDLGRYWVVDWKTAARMSGSSPGASDEFMLLDDQITSYCWALASIGFPVAGFVYAEIKKAVPEEPEPNKTQRLGRWYSVNKQIATTYDMYKQTVQENDAQAYAAGLYDDFLAYLKGPDGPKYHARHQIFRSETELNNAGVNIWHEASEMTDPHLRIYPSPGRFACSWCAYKEPCLGKNKGEDYRYTLNTLFEKRTKHYFEERQPTTDSRGGA